MSGPRLTSWCLHHHYLLSWQSTYFTSSDIEYYSKALIKHYRINPCKRIILLEYSSLLNDYPLTAAFGHLPISEFLIHLMCSLVVYKRLMWYWIKHLIKGKSYQLLLSNKLDNSLKKTTDTVMLGTELQNLSQNIFQRENYLNICLGLISLRKLRTGSLNYNPGAVYLQIISWKVK